MHEYKRNSSLLIQSLSYHCHHFHINLESESALLTKIKHWDKKVVMIVNKMDILTNEADKDQVLDFVSQHASKLLNENSRILPVFGVSGRYLCSLFFTVRYRYVLYSCMNIHQYIYFTCTYMYS
jgi:archaellum biogenesis ATPase FlaH